MSFIELTNLTKRFDEVVAVDRLNLAVDDGEYLCVLGPTGAGKTTMIKILVGLARPTSGSARVAGADCARELRKIKRLVGYMPDTFGSYDNMRVREYLDFFGAAFRVAFDSTSAEFQSFDASGSFLQANAPNIDINAARCENDISPRSDLNLVRKIGHWYG